MKKKSIFRQLLIPMVLLAAVLPAIVLLIFSTSYEQEIYSKNKQLSSLMAGEITVFMALKIRERAYKADEQDSVYSLSLAEASRPPFRKPSRRAVLRNDGYLAGCLFPAMQACSSAAAT